MAANIAKRPGQQNVGIITNQAGGIGDMIINAFKKDLPPNVEGRRDGLRQRRPGEDRPTWLPRC